MRLEVNGAGLNVEIEGAGRPLLLLHGFTGSAATWRPLLPHLPRSRTIALDLLGHGRSDSPADPARYSMERCLSDIAAVLDALDLSAVDLLGYSLGARIALHFALTHPGRVSRLVLESGTPGIADITERKKRRSDDEALADRIERDGIEAFVDYWQALPLWVSQAALPPAVREGLRAQRLKNDPVGLANSLRGVGTGACEPMFDRLSELTMPTLVIAGRLDERYVELAHLMAREAPAATLRIIENAGHAVHLEQLEEFAEAVREFLERPVPAPAKEARI